jgi:hypothetical protein
MISYSGRSGIECVRAADAAVSSAAFGKSCGLSLRVFSQLRQEARHSEDAQDMPTGAVGKNSSIDEPLPSGADHRFAPSKTGQDQ